MQYVKPDKRALVGFGYTFSVFFVIVFGFILPVVVNRHTLPLLFSNLELWPLWPWLVAGIITLWTIVHPGSLLLLHRPWMAFAHYVGLINTSIIMVILFYCIFFPIGLILRVFRKDAMRRSLDDGVPTYRITSDIQEKDHMRTPY